MIIMLKNKNSSKNKNWLCCKYGLCSCGLVHNSDIAKFQSITNDAITRCFKASDNLDNAVRLSMQAFDSNFKNHWKRWMKCLEHRYGHYARDSSELLTLRYDLGKSLDQSKNKRRGSHFERTIETLLKIIGFHPERQVRSKKQKGRVIDHIINVFGYSISGSSKTSFRERDNDSDCEIHFIYEDVVPEKSYPNFSSKGKLIFIVDEEQRQKAIAFNKKSGYNLSIFSLNDNLKEKIEQYALNKIQRQTITKLPKFNWRGAVTPSHKFTQRLLH